MPIKQTFNITSAKRCGFNTPEARKLYYYDKDAADRVIFFIENRCFHPDSGKQFILEPFQKQIIQDAYGWKRKKTGFRKHKFIYFKLPKGNGKSRLISGLSNYHLVFDRKKDGEIYVCAGDRKQAGIVFDDCKKMIEADKYVLEPRTKRFRDTIFHPKSNSKIQAISAEAYSKHGYRPDAVMFDELHVQPNRELYDTLARGLTKKPDSLLWMITTAGLAGSFWDVMDTYAQKIQDGVIENDFWLVRMFQADIDDPPFSKKTIKKANPGFGTIINPDNFEAAIKEARTMPSALNAYLRLHLNITTGSEKAFIPDHEWQKCDFGVLPEKKLHGATCYAGLDLAKKRDMSALVFFFPDLDKGRHYIKCKFYVPEATILARELQGHVEHSAWVRQGFLTVTPGNATDYDFIKKDFLEAAENYEITRLGYDDWNSSQFISGLTAEGFDRVALVRQGYKSMNEPTNMIEGYVLKQEINHAGNPILRWMTGNVVCDTDAAGNIKPNKAKSKEKIDGFVALVNAVYEYLQDQVNDTTSVYEKRGVVGF